MQIKSFVHILYANAGNVYVDDVRIYICIQWKLFIK